MQYLSLDWWDLHQYLDRDSRGLQGHMQIMIKDISPSQEHPASSRPQAMSSIFESVLDAFKLNGFPPNFKHSFLRASAYHSKHHQGHQPQSGTSKSSDSARNLQMSIIFEGVLDAFKLIGFQLNFKHSLLRVCTYHPKYHGEHQPQSGTSQSSSTPAIIGLP